MGYIHAQAYKLNILVYWGLYNNVVFPISNLSWSPKLNYFICLIQLELRTLDWKVDGLKVRRFMLILTHVLDIVQAFCDLIKTCTYYKLFSFSMWSTLKKYFLKIFNTRSSSYCLFYFWTMSNVLELLIKISNKLGFILTFLYVFNVF